MSEETAVDIGVDLIDKAIQNTVRPPQRAPTTNLARGGRGVFAANLQGATAKYIRGRPREVMQKSTMARMFVRVDSSELRLFRDSVGDPQVADRLLNSLIGDPAAPTQRGNNVTLSGYMDFLLTGVTQSLSETVQISPTLADNYVAYFFGQQPPVWQYQGVFINTVQDDQASNFYRLYLHVLRGTQLARRQKIISLKYDSFIVAGAMMNLQTSLMAANEIAVPFTFQLLVKRISLVNTTAGWVPTNPGGAFASDPLAVASDGAVQNQQVPRAYSGQTPPGTVEAPGRQQTEDARNHQTNPVPQPTVAGNPTAPAATPALVRSTSRSRSTGTSAATGGRPEQQVTRGPAPQVRTAGAPRPSAVTDTTPHTSTNRGPSE